MIRYPGLFLIAVLALSGCGSDKIAAIVNGQVIMVKELDARMSRLNPATRATLEKDHSRLVEEMVMETVLVQEAKRRGLENDPEVRSLMDEASRQILVGRLLELVRSGGALAEVNDQDMAKFYQENKGKFSEPETFRASHILVDSEESAKTALARVNGGEPFAQVAQAMSTDPSKSKGGDIGLFSKGQLIPEFEMACEKLKPGELSPVVKTPLGYHVILLTERRPPRELTFDEVKDQIRRQLMSQRQQQKVATFVQDLRAKAQVKVKLKEPSVPPASASSSTAASSQPPKP